MRTLFILYLLLATLSLSAQVVPDSLLRQTKVAQQVLTGKDSLDVRIQQAQGCIDSLRRLSRTEADSSQVGRYLQRQQDNLQQQLRHWEARRDSLFSPLDTLQQKMSNTQQRVLSLQDSLSERLPFQPALREVTDVTLPDELANQLSATPFDDISKKLSLSKLTPNLPELPQPIHAVREHVTAWQEHLSTYSDKLTTYQSKAAQYTAPLQQGTQAVEQQVLERVPEGELLQQNQQALQKWKADQAISEEQQQAQLQQRLLASARDHFANHSESLQKAQEAMVDLKKKYTLVQGTQQERRSSLHDQPLSERLVYGGTLQVKKGPPLAFDLSPLLGYQLNKRFIAGLGATYRLTLPKATWTSLRRSILATEAVYGGRAYAEYEVIESFLVHGEYERLGQVVPVMNQDASARSWQTSILAGIGKTYRIAGRLQGSVLILYNLRHRQQSVYASPWIFRFGFQRAGSQ